MITRESKFALSPLILTNCCSVAGAAAIGAAEAASESAPVSSSDNPPPHAPMATTSAMKLIRIAIFLDILAASSRLISLDEA